MGLNKSSLSHLESFEKKAHSKKEEREDGTLWQVKEFNKFGDMEHLETGRDEPRKHTNAYFISALNKRRR